MEIKVSISPEKDHSFKPRFISFISTSSSKLYLEIKYSLGENKISEFDMTFWSSKSKIGTSKKRPLSSDNLPSEFIKIESKPFLES